MSDRRSDIEILLVEDNPTDAELTIRALKKRNLANRLVWVKDGAEALDFIYGQGAYAGERGRPSLKVVLLDLRLPKVDGIEVLQRIKSDPSTRCTPVVILTSSKEDRDVMESYRLGVNSYISKPVEFEEFAKTVAELGLYWLMTNRAPSE